MIVVLDEYRNGDADSLSDEQLSTEPVDLLAIMRDEQLITAFLDGDEAHTASENDVEVVSLFSAARRAVIDAPIGFELTDEQIGAAMAAGSPRTARPRRVLTSLAAGVASVALVLGGLTIAVNSMGETSGPGESQSPSIVSASMIRADLTEAEDLLDSGDVVRGVELINATTSRMGQLDRSPEFDQLNKFRMQLWARATGQPESAAPEVGSTPTVSRDLKAQVPKVPAPQPNPVTTAPQVVLPPISALPVLPELPAMPDFPPIPELPPMPDFSWLEPGPTAKPPEVAEPEVTTSTPAPQSSAVTSVKPSKTAASATTELSTTPRPLP